MRISEQIINVRKIVSIVALIISLILAYTTKINAFIFIPMALLIYFIPFRFRVSLRVIYPRLSLMIIGSLFGLFLYKLSLIYLINVNFLIIGTLFLACFVTFLNIWLGFAVAYSILVFLYLFISQVSILYGFEWIVITMLIAVLIVLLSEWCLFKVVSCNDYNLINQLEIKKVITDSWDRFNQINLDVSVVNINDTVLIISELETYLIGINELRQNCIESFGYDCYMISELDNYRDKLLSIHHVLSGLSYSLLHKKDKLTEYKRYDNMLEQELYN